MPPRLRVLVYFGRFEREHDRVRSQPRREVRGGLGSLLFFSGLYIFGHENCARQDADALLEKNVAHVGVARAVDLRDRVCRSKESA